MKKILLVLMIFLLFSLVGCQKENKESNISDEKMNKVLSCNLKATRNNKEYISEETRIFYYDESGKKMKKYIQKVSYDYNSNNVLEEFAQKDYSSALETCEDIKDISGVICSVNKNPNTNRLSLELEVNLLRLEEKSEIKENLENLSNLPYEELKESFLNSSYPWKCE